MNTDPKAQEQLLALAGLFQAALLVDELACTGQANEISTNCLLKSVLIRDPRNSLAVYGGNDESLRNGFITLRSTLNLESKNARLLRYSLLLLGLERKFNKRADLLDLMPERLARIEQQSQHFSLDHDNVIAAFASLYQDTISTLKPRIQVQGDSRHLQHTQVANKIRALLLSGIRSARLWRQLGGNRGHFFFKRSAFIQLLNHKLDSRISR